MTHPQQQGFVLLYIVLVISSITVATALGLAQHATFTGDRMKTYNSIVQLRTIEMYCAENLMMQVRNTATLLSSGTLTYNGGSCTYTVAGTQPVKTINIVATYGTMYKRLNITTSQLFPVIVSSWVETP